MLGPVEAVESTVQASADRGRFGLFNARRRGAADHRSGAPPVAAAGRLRCVLAFWSGWLRTTGR